MTHSKDQNKSPKTVPEETQLSDLLDKDFKTTILYMLKKLKKKKKKVAWTKN